MYVECGEKRQEKGLTLWPSRDNNAVAVGKAGLLHRRVTGLGGSEHVQPWKCVVYYSVSVFHTIGPCSPWIVC